MSPDLNALLDAATPGPWEVSKVQGQDELRDEWHIATGDDPAEFPGAMWIRGPKFVDCDDTGLFFTPADAALIVAAVNALPRLLEIERAAMELDVQPCDFAGAEPKPGLRRWCLAHGEYDRGNGCPGGNLLVALARHNERGCTCDGDDGAHVGGCPALSPQEPTP